MSQQHVTLTVDQFRRLVRTVYEEAFFDGKTNGSKQTANECFDLSRSKDYCERLIVIDNPQEQTA